MSIFGEIHKLNSDDKEKLDLISVNEAGDTILLNNAQITTLDTINEIDSTDIPSDLTANTISAETGQDLVLSANSNEIKIANDNTTTFNATEVIYPIGCSIRSNSIYGYGATLSIQNSQQTSTIDMNIAGTIALNAGNNVINCTGNMSLQSNSQLRLNDNDNDMYVGLAAPTTVSSSYNITFPSNAGSANQLLVDTDGAGTLGWSDDLTLDSLTIDNFISSINAGTTMELSNNINMVPSGGLVNVDGTVNCQNGGKLQLRDSTNAFRCQIKADGVTADYNLTLPTSGSANNQILRADGTGQFSWVTQDQALSTTDDVQFNDVTVSGDLTVNGTTTTLNTASVEVEDAQIKLANSNTGDTIAIGIYGQYSSTNYTGFARDTTTDDWYCFDSTTELVDGTTVSGLNVARLHTKGVHGFYYISTSTVTTISTASTPIKLASTTTSFTRAKSLMSTSGNNKLVYDGSANTAVKIDVHATFDMVGTGSGEKVSFYAYKNGSNIAGSQQSVVENGGLTSISLSAFTTLNKNDYVEIYISNDTNTTNITVENMSVFIRGLD